MFMSVIIDVGKGKVLETQGYTTLCPTDEHSLFIVINMVSSTGICIFLSFSAEKADHTPR